MLVTSGTVEVFGPFETVSADGRALPGRRAADRALPDHRVRRLVVVDERRADVEPSAWSSELAWSIGSPTTRGHGDRLRPLRDVDPDRACPRWPSCSAGGSWASTVPAASAEGTCRSRGFKPELRERRDRVGRALADEIGHHGLRQPGRDPDRRPRSASGSLCPAIGLCLNTSPGAVVRLAWWLTTGAKPSALILSRASCSFMFRYSSTATGFVESSLLRSGCRGTSRRCRRRATKRSAAIHGQTGRRWIGSSRS